MSRSWSSSARAEVARRRDRREVRELERLYEAPPASSPTTMQGSAGVGFLGRHVAIDVHGGPRRVSIVRSPSFVLLIASISAVIVAALLSTADRVATRGLRADTVVRGPLLGPRFAPSEPSDEIPHTEPSPPSGEEQDGEEVETVGSDGVVHSSGEESVPEMVAAQPTSATSILLHWSAVAVATAIGSTDRSRTRHRAPAYG